MRIEASVQQHGMVAWALLDNWYHYKQSCTIMTEQ